MAPLATTCPIYSSGFRRLRAVSTLESEHCTELASTGATVVQKFFEFDLQSELK